MNETQTIYERNNNEEINEPETENETKIVYITPYEEEEIGKKNELKQITEPVNTSKYYEWIKGPHSVLCLVALLGILFILYQKGYVFNAPSNLVPWIFASLFIIVWSALFLPDSHLFNHIQSFGKQFKGWDYVICF